MSNEEKKARADHQAFRQKWFMILAGVTALFTLCNIMNANNKIGRASCRERV